MQLTKKQLEFWSVLLFIILGVSVLIMLVDFGIKAAILEESTRLRLRIEEFERGQKDSGTVPIGTTNDSPIDSAIHADLLVDESPGMETSGNSNGDSPKAANTRNRRRPKPSGQVDNPAV